MFVKRREYAAQPRAASGINIVLGIVLIASPWVFDYNGTVLVAVLAIWSGGATIVAERHPPGAPVH
jgi:hypothetical protein